MIDISDYRKDTNKTTLKSFHYLGYKFTLSNPIMEAQSQVFLIYNKENPADGIYSGEICTYKYILTPELKMGYDVLTEMSNHGSLPFRAFRILFSMYFQMQVVDKGTEITLDKNSNLIFTINAVPNVRSLAKLEEKYINKMDTNIDMSLKYNFYDCAIKHDDGQVGSEMNTITETANAYSDYSMTKAFSELKYSCWIDTSTSTMENRVFNLTGVFLSDDSYDKIMNHLTQNPSMKIGSIANDHLKYLGFPREKLGEYIIRVDETICDQIAASVLGDNIEVLHGEWNIGIFLVDIVDLLVHRDYDLIVIYGRGSTEHRFSYETSVFWSIKGEAVSILFIDKPNGMITDGERYTTVIEEKLGVDKSEKSCDEKYRIVFKFENGYEHEKKHIVEITDRHMLAHWLSRKNEAISYTWLNPYDENFYTNIHDGLELPHGHLRLMTNVTMSVKPTLASYDVSLVNLFLARSRDEAVKYSKERIKKYLGMVTLANVYFPIKTSAACIVYRSLYRRRDRSNSYNFIAIANLGYEDISNGADTDTFKGVNCLSSTEVIMIADFMYPHITMKEGTRSTGILPGLILFYNPDETII